MDPRVRKLADVLVNYSVAVQPGDLVWLRYESLAEEAGLAVYEQILQAGGNPVVTMSSSSGRFGDAFMRLANDDQLNFMDPVTHWLTTNADVRISLGGPGNTKALSNADPARLATNRKANEPIIETFMDRQGRGDLRWVGTRVPTQAAAQDAEMSLDAYIDFVYSAGMLHLDDPAEWWRQFSVDQQRLVDWLEGKKQVEVKGDNIDLTLSIDGRTFINADGKKNFPDGEIFTGPVEDSVNGWVRFTYPAVYSGREVNGVQIKFE
ncbi:MAG: aminopeptidase, partial [Anaerolineae bacterium]